MELSLEYGEHFTNGVKDATGQLFLIVDSDPSTKNCSDFPLKDLRDLLFLQWLSVKDGMVLVLSWSITKTASIRSLLCELAEDVLGVLRAKVHVVDRSATG